MPLPLITTAQAALAYYANGGTKADLLADIDEKLYRGEIDQSGATFCRNYAELYAPRQPS